MESVHEENQRLRRCVRDVVAISALPAVWVGYDSLRIAESLADVLLRTLALDLIYLRIQGPAQDTTVEIVRMASSVPPSPDQARQVVKALAPWLTPSSSGPPAAVPNPVGAGTLRLATMRLGHQGQFGMLAGGSQRFDFPTEMDHLLLNVGANQAASVLQQKQAEDAVRAQREQFRITLASIGDAVIVTDAHERVTSLNSIAESLTGWRQADAAGQPLRQVFQIVNEDTRQPVDNPVAKVLRDGVVVGLANHTLLIGKDGTEHPIDDSAAPIRDESGVTHGVVLVFRDVTEQRRAERELRQSEARKAAILANALDGIITCDHEGRVIEFNPAAEQIFGYRREQVIGKELGDLLIPPSLREGHRQGMARYLATGAGSILNRRIEMPARRADGSEFPVELAITSISTDGPPLFTAHLRDISGQKRAEQHRNARLAVTQVLSEAAHVEDGAGGVIRAVCENLGWDVGLFWRVNDAGTALVCLQSWHNPVMPVAEFEAASYSRTFANGEGLPGRVWASGKPAWILDLANDPNFPRLASAARHGLHSAFASPVVGTGKTLGVVEFFTRHIREADGDLLETMGTVAGNVGQFIERKTAEDELRRSEQELGDFFENATVGLHWVGPDGIILRANRAELDLLGYRREEYVGRPVAEFHADEEVICDMLQRLQAGEQLSEYPARLRCKDGSIKEVLIDSSVLFRDGLFVHTRCFTRDVTQRKRSEHTSRFLADASAALAVLEDFDSTLQKVASLAVPSFADWASVDLLEDGETLRRVAVAHWDQTKVEWAHEVHHRFPADPAAPHGVWHILRTGQSEIGPEITDALLVQAVRDDELRGILRQLGLKSYIGVPLTVRGKTLGVLTFIIAESGYRYDHSDLVVAQDLASRAAIAIENSQLYRQLRDDDRRKDEFLATLAHELRNPMAPIRNGLQVLKLADDPAARDQAREMMERQLGQMVRLVDDLLDISRITRNKLELRKARIELTAVIENAVETARPQIEASGHTFVMALPPRPVYLDADLTRLAQVFWNLLNNSAKYTDPGGRISLTAELQDGEVVVAVGDTGIGIPASAQPRLFELFSQVDRSLERSQGGLGIGLALVKGLTEMHGGTVTVQSAGAGHGSTFVVRLPVAHGVPVQKPPAPSSVADGQKRRILVVDDNRDGAASLAMLLSLTGHDARTAHDGLEAVELAEAFQPELIVLDIGLPKLNGYDACRRIREQPWGKQIVIVAATGWGQEEDRRRSTEAGFDAHLVKPVDLAALHNLLAGLESRP